MFELVGYAGSILIIVSLAMKSVLRLRIVGLAGAAVFAAYGGLIGSVPVVATNLIILGVHAYFLREMLSAKEFFTLLEVLETSAYLRYFIDFHADEIAQRLPDYSFRATPNQVRLFILRNAVPAGLLIADLGEPGIMTVDLDFVIPQYRDFKIARYLYTPGSGVLADREIHTVFNPAGSDDHQRYLRRMGFVPSRSRPGYFRLALAERPDDQGNGLAAGKEYHPL